VGTSTTLTGRTDVYAKTPLPGESLFGEVSGTVLGVKVGAARNSLKEGTRTDQLFYSEPNFGFFGLAEKTLVRRDAATVGVHLVVGGGFYVKVDFGRILEAFE